MGRTVETGADTRRLGGHLWAWDLMDRALQVQAVPEARNLVGLMAKAIAAIPAAAMSAMATRAVKVMSYSSQGPPA
ncbi:hypothetical protein ACFVV7_35615 [Streptomyces globisporus]|uniref:hypothetical protein n=1 Tax=Streptomyces globisporus TaxID=1908 RepID=UPI0036DDDF51